MNYKCFDAMEGSVQPKNTPFCWVEN